MAHQSLVKSAFVDLKNRHNIRSIEPSTLNKTFIVSGIVLLAAGAAVYYVSSYTDLLGGRTHHIIPLGGLGLAVLGALVAVGGAMMGKAGGAKADQFKCAKCGAVFGSQTALDQHTKDKHGK